ncbi:hypothetical protein [Mesorhizobium sp.]
MAMKSNTSPPEYSDFVSSKAARTAMVARLGGGTQDDTDEARHCIISYVGPRSGAFFGERHCDPEVGGDVGLRGVTRQICDPTHQRFHRSSLEEAQPKHRKSAYNHDKAKERGQRVRFSEQVDSLKVQEIGRKGIEPTATIGETSFRTSGSASIASEQAAKTNIAQPVLPRIQNVGSL